MTNPTIPIISLPQGKLCLLEELELQQDKPTEQSHDKREMYAKMALFDVLFFLTIEQTDMWWKLLEIVLQVIATSPQESNHKILEKRLQYTSKYRRQIYPSKTPQKSKGFNYHVNN